MESFSVYIKCSSIANGLNQTKLAAKFELDSGGLTKIENRKKIKKDRLTLFSQALDIEIEELKNQFFSEKFAEECLRYVQLSFR